MKNMITVKQLIELQKPRVILLEQPCVLDYQLWYESDLRSRKAIIPGASKGSLPKISILGYTGKVYVCLSAVTATEKDEGKGNFMPHPFKVVSRRDPESHQRGFTVLKTNVDTSGHLELEFGLVGVIDKRKEFWLNIREKEKVDPFSTGFEHPIKDFSSVRIAIQVFTTCHVLNPIVTEPLLLRRGKKLKIKYMTPVGSSCLGGTLITILCDRVQKQDVVVEFLHERSGWKDVGKITEDPGIYHKVVIVFESPPFLDTMISRTEIVKVQLRRPSDGQTSNSMNFQMMPDTGSDKRKRDDWSNNLGTISRMMESDNKKKFKESLTSQSDLTNEIQINLSTNKLLFKENRSVIDHFLCSSKTCLPPPIMPELLGISQFLIDPRLDNQLSNKKSNNEYILPDIDLDFLNETSPAY